MIEDIWRNKLKEKRVVPEILKNCKLYIEMDYYLVGTTYAFINIDWTKKLDVVGDFWTHHKQAYKRRKGFFSCDFPRPFIGENDVISLFGYSQDKQYQLLDLRLDFQIENGIVKAASFDFKSFTVKNIVL